MTNRLMEKFRHRKPADEILDLHSLDPTQTFTSIDLFSGAGGLILGLEAAGFRTRLECDLWAPAASTFRSNFPHIPFLESDVRSLDKEELLGIADLSGLDLVALMVDGVHFAGHCCVVALCIDIDGGEASPGIVEGDTENATLVTELLAGLRDRGLCVTRPILCVLDGAKALARAVKAVFDHPVIARCQLLKIRNVKRHLPDNAARVIAAMGARC